MRRRLALSLLLASAACGPAPLRMSPDEGSARGGELVEISGRRFPAEPEVFIDGRPAELVERLGRRALQVRTPAGLAGLVDVEVRDRRGRGAPLESAFLYLPIELDYALAPAHYLPEPENPLAQAQAGDLDGDGLSEIVLLDEAGALSLWRGSGLGAFAEHAPPALSGAAGGVAVAQGPDGPALFVCHADGQAARLFAPEPLAEGELWAELPTPTDAGACLGARALDLDGDGVDELVELRADGARLWRIEDGALLRWPSEELAAAEAVDAEGCGALTVSEGSEGSCEVSEGVAQVSLSGEGSVTLALELPPMTTPDAGFTLRLAGSSPALRVVDAAGQSFSLTLPSGDTAERSLQTLPVAEWSPASEGATPSLPLARLELELSGGTSLALDRITLELEGGGRLLVSDFSAWPVDAALDGALSGAALSAAALRGEEGGATSLALGGADGVALFSLDDGAARLLPGRLPQLACEARAMAAVDLDADGLEELAVACADGQDRLFRGDGAGRWFEDAAASLPVDDAQGADLAGVDLDRDGLPELIVANRDGVDRLYHGEGDRLADWSPRLDLEPRDSLAVLPLDVDGDGDLDLLFVEPTGARLFVLRGE